MARHVHCVSVAITSWLHQLHRKAAAHHRRDKAAAAKGSSGGVAATVATGGSLAERRLQHPRGLGASIRGVPGSQGWAQPRGALVGLADSTGNLERRFRTYSEVHTVQRSILLDTTVDTMMLAHQALPLATCELSCIPKRLHQPPQRPLATRRQTTWQS